MPADRSADGLRRAARVRAVLQPAVFAPRQKLLLLALNAWPLLHAAGTVAWLVGPAWTFGARLAAAAAWLLLLPPLAARLVVGRGLATGEIAVPSSAFFRWWTTWQLQMVFNRLPWLEEVLRLIPGVYSAWLRLWGARIGRLTLWSPGVRIFDRPLLHLGDDVVLGLDVRVTGHFGGLDAAGRSTMTLGPVTLRDRTTIGAAALLGPGLEIDADQATETLFLGPPFTCWQNGRRVDRDSRPSQSSSP